MTSGMMSMQLTKYIMQTMKIIKKIIKWSLIYNFSQMLHSGITYIKDRMKIGDVFYSDSFKLLMKRYLAVDLDTDWIGRQYGIVNPMIDINGNLDINSMIIEINGDATNNIEQLKVWVYRQLSLVGNLFRLQGIYDYIDVEFRHVGPLTADNYLLIFDMVSRQRFAYFLKRTAIQSILYIITFGAIYFFALS